MNERLRGSVVLAIVGVIAAAFHARWGIVLSIIEKAVSSSQQGLPFLGVGLGYRRELHASIYAHKQSIDWLEVISEHYTQGPPERMATGCHLARDFVVIPHGVEMSIGTEGEVDSGYLNGLSTFVNAIHPPWFSDHLCFTRAGGISLGTLTPLNRTRAVARAVAAKAQRVQELIGVPFILENIARQFTMNTELSEAEFICEFLEHCDCGLLLDLTNVYINSVNYSEDALRFLDSIPSDRVVQIHLAGGKTSPHGLIDSHSSPVPGEVWELLDYLLRAGAEPKGLMIERDQDYPEDFDEILTDLNRARNILAAAMTSN
ncbi:MAG TPA: DUF692 domain-containing protein [Terriglobales bacterium]